MALYVKSSVRLFNQRSQLILEVQAAITSAPQAKVSSAY